ncbi:MULTISPECIES: substrate-binding domain-containing protein [Paraburkholderia]|uniref:substrate-binding domain-containing protein n=1 Tax=Paraburkholderia TaxID=1822464 RepID=UPI0015E8E0C2|nr:solute-binding protein [Paraburkholderia tropica]
MTCPRGHLASDLQPAIGRASFIDGLPSIRDKIRPHANGETAMRALSEEARVGAIGITQATEIKYTNHLTLVGLLPDRYRLSTTYSVAVSKGSSSDATARSLIELLTSSATRDIRHSCGFESATGGHLA